jgi:hypothetical protein
VLSLARWTALCAAAETVGMTAAAGAAKAAQAVTGDPATGAETAVGLSIIVAGGLVEGVALGTAQAAGLGRLVPGLDRRRWVAVTIAVAGVGWAGFSAPAALGGEDGAAPPVPVMLAGAAVLGAGMGAVLGAAQALVLRGRVPNPWRWVGANAVAWVPVMTIIFLGAGTPDSDWSVPAVLGLGAVTGAAAGAVLGLVTGRFLPSLTGHALRSGRADATLHHPAGP